jgi:hypothetical protein
VVKKWKKGGLSVPSFFYLHNVLDSDKEDVRIIGWSNELKPYAHMSTANIPSDGLTKLLILKDYVHKAGYTDGTKQLNLDGKSKNTRVKNFLFREYARWESLV